MKKLLDIGCGPGAINNLGYYKVLENKYKIYGIDMLQKNIDLISKRYPRGIFRQAKAEKIPYKKNSFEFILSRHVLEHVKDINKTISEIKRVTKPNAFVLIAIPHPTFENVLTRLVPHYLGEGHHHERIFRENDIEKIFKKNGFKIIKSSQEKWPMFVVTILLSFIAKIFNKVKMEEQTGVFYMKGKNYLKINSAPLENFLSYCLTFLNRISILNNVIPFEVEVLAQKVKE